MGPTAGWTPQSQTWPWTWFTRKASWTALTMGLARRWQWTEPLQEGPLSANTGRQIHDSDNGKTRNRDDLERTLGWPWNSKPEQTPSLSKSCGLTWAGSDGGGYGSSWFRICPSVLWPQHTPLDGWPLNSYTNRMCSRSHCWPSTSRGKLPHFGIWCRPLYCLQSCCQLSVFQWSLALLIGKKTEEMR